MDLSIRDWMLVIGVLLILAVLLDGYRRVRRDRSNKVRMALKPVPPGSDEENITRGELPNGGARIATRGNRNIDPVFGNDPGLAGDAVPERAFSATVGDDDVVLPAAPLPQPQPRVLASPAAQPAVAEPAPAAGASFGEVLESVATAQPAEPARAAAPAPAPAAEAAPAADSGASAAESESPVTSGVREIIVVNAISRDPAGFNGEELLHILLTCDLRFGKMNIFHRYERSNAKGAVQFSVANAVEPGTFDLNNMRSFSTPGICLFMQLPGPQDAQKALEYMIETAQCIARNLNGELRDENRSALTAQTIEHYRSRIREFDRKRLARHA